VHGYEEIVDKILEYNPDSDYVISLGDTELTQEYLINHDIIHIKGNYRHDPGFVFERDFLVEGKKFFLTHGHKYAVHRGLNKLGKHILGKDYDVVLYGHTHIASINEYDKTYFINPGSCARPRNTLPPTYLVIHIIEGEMTFELHEMFTNKVIEI
jgi:putative phosphoesterase